MACAFKNLLSHLETKNGGMWLTAWKSQGSQWAKENGGQATVLTLATDICEWQPTAFLGMVRPAFNQVKLLRLPQAYLSVARWQGGRGQSEHQLVYARPYFSHCLPPLSGLWASEKLPSSFGQMKPGKQAWPLSLTLFCCEKDKRGTMKTRTDGMKADPCKVTEPSSQP